MHSLEERNRQDKTKLFKELQGSLALGISELGDTVATTVHPKVYTTKKPVGLAQELEEFFMVQLKFRLVIGSSLLQGHILPMFV